MASVAFHGTINSVRGLVVALQAIRSNLKLPCALSVDPSGLNLRFLDGAHAMQSGIFLGAAVRQAGSTGVPRRGDSGGRWQAASAW